MGNQELIGEKTKKIAHLVMEQVKKLKNGENHHEITHSINQRLPIYP